MGTDSRYLRLWLTPMPCVGTWYKLVEPSSMDGGPFYAQLSIVHAKGTKRVGAQQITFFKIKV